MLQITTPPSIQRSFLEGRLSNGVHQQPGVRKFFFLGEKQHTASEPAER